MKICIITTGHQKDDIRIFLKEIKSLKKLGHEIFFVVQNDKQEYIDGVNIIPINLAKGRLDRFLRLTEEAYNEAQKINADIYHFHDPEFLPKALKLAKTGKCVIYDVHENVPKQILSKKWIPTALGRKIVSNIFDFYEKLCVKKFTAVIGAYEDIAKRFRQVNDNVEIIANYPIINEFLPKENLIKSRTIIYAGIISRARGIKQLVSALNYLENIELILCGNFTDEGLEAELQLIPGWDKVIYKGQVSRTELKQYFESALAGIVTFLPTEQHIAAEPNKLFEYMSAGLPVVASNFEGWDKIVKDSDSGITVNPESSEEIAEAIKVFLDNVTISNRMGYNGRKAVEKKYNWENEEKKLYNLYEKLQIRSQV